MPDAGHRPPLHPSPFTLHPRPSPVPFPLSPVLALIAAGLAAVSLAALSTLVHPLAAAGLVAGLGLAAAILRHTQAGLLAVIGVAYLLPFAVLPLPIGGVRLTFLDATVTLLLAVWLMKQLSDPSTSPVFSPLAAPILFFLGLILTSFVIGIQSVSAETFRFFLKTINSILFFFTVVNCVRTTAQVQQVIRALLLCAMGAAVIALGLYALDPDTASRLLAALRPLGYPSGQGLLRYIATTDILRAIGTSIDPNVLGGMLLLALPLGVGQVMEKRPLLDRRLLVAGTALLVLALLLTYSRSSWIGATAGVIFLGGTRHRRLWIVLVVFLLALAFSPAGELILGRVESGLLAEDRAAQMRLGEYRDSLRLIAQYPWFGVGFGTPPDIDLYIATSSVYLLIAEQMGLIGLAAFLAIVAVLFAYALRAGRVGATHASPLRADGRAAGHDPLRSLRLAALASVAGALSAGLFDHYFFNLHFPHTVALFWLFVGLTVAATRLGQTTAGTGTM